MPEQEKEPTSEELQELIVYMSELPKEFALEAEPESLTIMRAAECWQSVVTDATERGVSVLAVVRSHFTKFKTYFEDITGPCAHCETSLSAEDYIFDCGPEIIENVCCMNCGIGMLAERHVECCEAHWTMRINQREGLDSGLRGCIAEFSTKEHPLHDVYIITRARLLQQVRGM